MHRETNTHLRVGQVKGHQDSERPSWQWSRGIAWSFTKNSSDRKAKMNISQGIVHLWQYINTHLIVTRVWSKGTATQSINLQSHTDTQTDTDWSICMMSLWYVDCTVQSAQNIPGMLTENTTGAKPTQQLRGYAYAHACACVHSALRVERLVVCSEGILCMNKALKS